MKAPIPPPANCDLSIIIVNWNTRDLLVQCLNSLSATERQIDLEVIVVDSASSDGSPAMVKEHFPQVRLVENKENLGFAKGNNLAIKQAAGRHILLLNPDTIIIDNAITDLDQVLKQYPDLGIVGAQLLNADGSLQRSWGVFPTVLTEIPLFNRFSRTRPQRVLEHRGAHGLPLYPVDYVSGACLMSKREVFGQIGMLDEDFWLYTEEVDFCYRAQLAGWGVGSLPRARVTHVARAASRQRYVKTMLYFYQSRIRFIFKHHGPFLAKMAKRITAVKARLWQQTPQKSPLYKAYGSSLTDDQIRSAYDQLWEAMSQPLETLMATAWA